jgi:hypothetical protein
MPLCSHISGSFYIQQRRLWHASTITTSRVPLELAGSFRTSNNERVVLHQKCSLLGGILCLSWITERPGPIDLTCTANNNSQKNFRAVLVESGSSMYMQRNSTPDRDMDRISPYKTTVESEPLESWSTHRTNDRHH